MFKTLQHPSGTELILNIKDISAIAVDKNKEPKMFIMLQSVERTNEIVFDQDLLDMFMVHTEKLFVYTTAEHNVTFHINTDHITALEKDEVTGRIMFKQTSMRGLNISGEDYEALKNKLLLQRWV